MLHQEIAELKGKLADFEDGRRIERDNVTPPPLPPRLPHLRAWPRPPMTRLSSAFGVLLVCKGWAGCLASIFAGPTVSKELWGSRGAAQVCLKVLGDKCLRRSIVTRAHVPRQVKWELQSKAQRVRELGPSPPGAVKRP